MPSARMTAIWDRLKVSPTRRSVERDQFAVGRPFGRAAADSRDVSAKAARGRCRRRSTRPELATGRLDRLDEIIRSMRLPERRSKAMYGDSA